MFLLESKQKPPSNWSSSQIILICSVSVFTLWRLIRTNVSSSISASTTRILPLLSFFILSALIYLLRKYPIIAPQEFAVPFEKNNLSLKLSRQLMTVSWDEWVSCKYNIPLFAVFSLKYSNILIRFFDKLTH